MLTMADDDESVFAALQVGARGYVLKGALKADVLRAIRGVHSGDAIFGGAVATRLGVPVAMVEQLRHAGRLLAIPDAQGYHYPSWQFEGRGVLAGLPTVLAGLPGADPWKQIAFVLMPQ